MLFYTLFLSICECIDLPMRCERPMAQIDSKNIPLRLVWIFLVINKLLLFQRFISHLGVQHMGCERLMKFCFSTPFQKFFGCGRVPDNLHFFDWQRICNIFGSLRIVTKFNLCGWNWFVKSHKCSENEKFYIIQLYETNVTKFVITRQTRIGIYVESINSIYREKRFVFEHILCACRALHINQCEL